MSLSAKIGRVITGKAFREKAREERRKKTIAANGRRRIFEALEPRQMLDATSPYETLPEVITIADPSSYHYAYEGSPNEFVDQSSVDGLNASFVTGNQIAFTVEKKSATDGAVSSLGEVVIQLFNDDAPNSVSNFLSLYYSDYYDGKTFHRVIPGFMFQGGSSDGYGFQGSGTSIADEYSDVLKHSGRGIVAYANSNNAQTGRTDTSDAQFYITFTDCSWLDNGYNIFGFVVDGYEVLDEMEKVETHTVDNPYGSKSENFPVDTYSITNMRLIDAESVSQSAFRVVAGENASGVTKLSFSSNLADDALKFQETTVYVGKDGLQKYIEEALTQTNFEFVAGETISVSLPKEFGGYDVKYTVTSESDPVGYSIEGDGHGNFNDFTIKTEDYAAQYATIKIEATLQNGLTATVSQPMYIAPIAPTVSINSSSDTKVGDLEGNVKIISSNLADSALVMNVLYKGLDHGATTDKPISVYVDGEEYAYNVVEHTYDVETHTHNYKISLQLKDSQKLADGMHSIAVRDYVSVFRDGSWSRLYSDYATVDALVDTKELAFTESALTLELNTGATGIRQLHTNKADSEGVERSDIVFSLANPEAGPRFISLSETGVLSWDNITDEDLGTYYVSVKATDALGNVATMKLTLVVGCVPVFDEIEPITLKTGEKLDVTASAKVPGSETARIKYELVGDSLPNGLAIDSSTGRVTWDVAEDYLGSESIKLQKSEIVVKATSSIKQEDGSYVDGSSVEATIDLTLLNAQYDSEKALAPTWNEIADASVNSGEKFELVVSALAGESKVEYQLTTCPPGMTIDQEGNIEWKVPEDYFASDKIKTQTLTINLKATTLVSEDGTTKNYGDEAETSFKLVVNNAKYQDYAPVFEALENPNATTGETFTATVVATDPNGLADRVYLELVGNNYPENFAFDSKGGMTWEVPSDLLSESTSYRKMLIEVKATEQFLGADGTYTDGLSSTQSFTIYVKNNKVDDSKLLNPVWDDIEAEQTIEAGKSFALNVNAKAKPKTNDENGDSDVGSDVPQEDLEYKVEYAIVDGAPKGMTIDPKTGAIAWDAPKDYFEGKNVKSEKLTIKLSATTILSETDKTLDYGGTTEKSFDLTVTNPNYEDKAPVFEELANVATSTGATYEATIVATDPEGVASIKLELIGDKYPSDFKFDPATGKVEWKIPENYLATNISAQTFAFTIKATEQIKDESGKLVDGQSTEKVFEIMVANSRYSSDQSVVPTIEKIPAQTVKAGETLTVEVKATATQTVTTTTTGSDGKPQTSTQTKNCEVEYSLGKGAPEGMTIDAKTGKIEWKVPEDYFNSDKIDLEKLTVEVTAKTVLSREGEAVNYSGSASTSFELTVTNPKYNPGEYSNWREWFDAWVANEQSRNEGHTTNLANYIDAYLNAVDERQASLAKAKESYASGKTTLTQFLQERDKVMNDYDKAVEDARVERAEADAKVEQAYQETLKGLNYGYDALSEDKSLTKPENVKENAQAAANQSIKDATDKATGSANFRIASSNGAKVATDLNSVLKLWREGYAYRSVYDEIFSDMSFVESVGDETSGSGNNQSGDNQGESGGSGDNQSGDNQGESGGSGDNQSGDNQGESGGSGDNQSGDNQGESGGSGDNQGESGGSGDNQGESGGSGDNQSGDNQGESSGSDDNQSGVVDKDEEDENASENR